MLYGIHKWCCITHIPSSMTVLRRVESLGRSHRLNWRKYKLASEQQRYPITSLHPSPIFYPSSAVIRVHAMQSFSTFGNDFTPVQEQTPDEALQAAFSRAQLINEQPKMTTLNLKDVMEAATALLQITSNTKLLQMGISKATADTAQVKTLHQAFIVATSRCLLLVSQDASLLSLALELARRAHDLQLPLHLPLQQSLCTELARHNPTLQDDDLVETILEIADMAVSSLHITLQCSFFSEALIALIQHGYFTFALELVHEMKYRFDVCLIDIPTVERAMKAIDPQLADTRQESIHGRQLIIQLMHDWKIGQQRVHEMWRESRFNDLVRELDEYDSSEEDDDDDDSDEYSDYDSEDETENEPTMEELFLKYADEISNIGKPTRRAEQSATREEVLLQVQMNAETGDVEGFNVSSSSLPQDETQENEELDAFASDIIYLRDVSSWMLPDVTLQLVELNGNEEVLYTRQYEEEILQQVMKSRGDYF